MPAYVLTSNNRKIPVEQDQIDRLDLIETATGYHLVADDKSVSVKVISIDLPGKQISLEVGGRAFSYEVADEVDQLVEGLGFSAVAGAASKDVLAPMPGLVRQVLVEAGQEVAKDTPLLILEAMKMENILRAEGEGTVTELLVAPGEAVEKKQLLIRVE